MQNARICWSAALALTLALLGLVAFATQTASADTSFSAQNDSGETASGVVVYLSGQAQAKVINTAAPGCGTPAIDYFPNGPADIIDFSFPTATPVPTPIGGTFYSKFVATWPTACLAPGASITFEFDTGCSCTQPQFSAHEWLPRPAPSGQLVVWPHNDTGHYVSALRVELLAYCIDFSSGSTCGPHTTFAPSIVSILQNPPGCPAPQVTAISTLDLQFVWSTACVGLSNLLEAQLTGCDQCNVQSVVWSSDAVGGAVVVPASSGNRDLKAPLLAAFALLAAVSAGLFLARRSVTR